MFCTRCRSTNVQVQVTQQYQTKKQHHGVAYWLLIGWWLHPLLWLFLTIPMLLIRLFAPKRQTVTAHERTVAVCQSCGNRWYVQ